MNQMPIVMDIEASGLNKSKCGIWQIGAVDLNDINEFFIEDSRIDDEDFIENEALKISGMNKEKLKDKSKQTQRELISNFLRWVEKRSMKNFLCQNPQFDIAFIEEKAKKYGLKETFHYRGFDLHSIAQLKFFQLNGHFLLDENNSAMGLSNILSFCGMKDNREEHNALEDAKLTGECFSRIVLGKNLFPEYSKFKIPEELKNELKTYSN